MSKFDFQYFTVVPVLSNGYAVLGEQSKWISGSSARITNIRNDGLMGSASKFVEVNVRGNPGEMVEISYTSLSNGLQVEKIGCEIKADNTAVFLIPNGCL